MCGRYTVRFTEATRLPVHLAQAVPPFAPRYNIAPQQKAPVIRQADGKPKFEELVWGFRPSWLKDKNKAQINARAETLFSKPMFKQSALSRRCLVLATGWYEWQKQPGGKKQPYAFHLEHDALFAFAGIWTRWHGEGEEAEENYAIVTTDVNPLAAKVHNRMPVVLTRESCEQWLNEGPEQAAELEALLKPYGAKDLDAYRVSTYVNKPSNTSAECLRPI